MYKPRILFISSRPIYPIIGGDQIRTEQQLDFLSRHYQVDVVFLSNSKYPDTQSYLKFASSAKAFFRPKIYCLFGTLRFIFNKLPLQVNYYYDRNLQQYINRISKDYEMVFCNNIRTTEFARKLCGPKKVIDFVDAISMNYDKARKYSSGLKKLIYEIDYRRCRAYEKILLNEFDACSIISEVDKKYIESCQK